MSYREALMDRYPDVGMDLDDKFLAWGEQWVAPMLEQEIELDEWVTIDVAASFVGLTTAGVYTWVYREKVPGKVGNDKRLRVKLQDVIDQNAIYRRQRIAAEQEKARKRARRSAA